MSDELVIRQVWPVPRGHSVLSPFEASEDFEQACWQASEVIAASPSDLFYTFTRAGQEVVRLIIVDHPDLDPGYGVPDAGDGLEIDFMEVASGYRRQGLGTQAIVVPAGEGPDAVTSRSSLRLSRPRCPPGCVIDGEAVIWSQGRDFSALQQRLGAGPKTLPGLVRGTPASYAAFDVLAVAGHEARELPLSQRRALLEELAGGKKPPLSLSPTTTDPVEAARWFEEMPHTGIEGLIINSLLNERVDAVQERGVN